MILTSVVLGLVLLGGQVGDAQGTATDGDAAAAATEVVESLFRPGTARYRDDPVGCVRDGNTLQLNACVAEDLSGEEARLRRYFEAAMTRAIEGDAQSGQFGEERTHQAAWLDASQRSWEAYAGIRCGGVFDQWKGGTIRTIMITGCRIEATRQRTHDIWTDHLTYADSTPPVLPEPVLTVFEEQETAAQRP